MASRRFASLLAALACTWCAGCDREKRDLYVTPALAATGQSVLASNPFTGNAYAIAEGARLFEWYNCAGCHGHGGGGIGPPLMENNLHYGSAPGKVFESIAKGRPNGMPAWGTRIPQYQIWQLVAFIRSMSGEQPRPAIPARSDGLERKTGIILQRRPAP